MEYRIDRQAARIVEQLFLMNFYKYIIIFVNIEQVVIKI